MIRTVSRQAMSGNETRWGRGKTLHQFLTGAATGDAITSHALTLRNWLRELGFSSDVYAQFIDESMRDDVRPLAAYRHAKRQRQAIYHHSIGSDVPSFLQERNLRLILIYHNVTPATYFRHVDPAWENRSSQGQSQLRSLRAHVDLGLADSAYNELGLKEAGYERTGVLPITIDEAHYDLVDNARLAEQLDAEGPTLLFVGRLAPNKKQEDLVKLLYCYRRICPSAHLLLVGDRWTVGYDRWVEQLAQKLELGRAVKLTGKVSQQDLVTCYRHSHLYISMSEHEGFGKPLVESMVLGLPVLAYAAAAVPYTLGHAGVQFHQKDFERLAELVDILIEDDALRRRIIDAQREKMNEYLAPQVRRQFIAYLERSLA